MPFEPIYSERFTRQLLHLSKDKQVAVGKKITQIRENPEHFDFLRGEERLQKARVGNLRILFIRTGNTILFDSVAKRDVAYRKN